MKLRHGVLLGLALVACNRAPSPSSPLPAATPASKAASIAATSTGTQAASSTAAAIAPVDRDIDIASRSASLMGVAEDADATPADLDAASTYRLPGPLSRQTTRVWLEQRYGNQNVKVGDVPGAEGETSRGIVLFPDDPTRRVYLYFKDEHRLRDLVMASVQDAPSRWQLDNGIGIGTPLSKLVELNGKPITFSGFDWDYGGVVNGWNHGRLQAMGDGRIGRDIRLDHRDGRYPMGEDTYASNDPRYPKLGQTVMVGEISVSFPDDADR